MLGFKDFLFVRFSIKYLHIIYVWHILFHLLVSDDVFLWFCSELTLSYCASQIPKLGAGFSSTIWTIGSKVASFLR